MKFKLENLKNIGISLMFGLLLGFSIYVVANVQYEHFAKLDAACENTNETIWIDEEQVDCQRWKLGNYTLI